MAPANPIARMTAVAAPAKACARLALLLLACISTAALAEDRTQGTCVEVEIDGERSLSVECLNQRLQPPAPRQPAAPSLSMSETSAAMPSNQLGLFNRAALSNRMGSNFGKSAHPQRPLDAFQPPPLLESR